MCRLCELLSVMYVCIGGCCNRSRLFVLVFLDLLLA